jgi:hypothetical protein
VFIALRLLTVQGLLLLSCILAGCFTEVGNAQDDRLVQAKFQIEYTTGPTALPKTATTVPETTKVGILQFYLSIEEAEFDLLDSITNRKEEFHLWKEDSALDVDFLGLDSSAVLPVEKVGILNPHDMHLHCQFPGHRVLGLDTIDFTRFHDRSYIKGIFTTGKSTTPFLFALPNTGGFELTYMADILGSWYSDGIYHCRFVFFANNWVAGLKLGNAILSKDKTGTNVMVLDPEHNGLLHDSLETRFYKSFNSSRATYTADP